MNKPSGYHIEISTQAEKFHTEAHSTQQTTTRGYRPNHVKAEAIGRTYLGESIRQVCAPLTTAGRARQTVTL